MDCSYVGKHIAEIRKFRDFNLKKLAVSSGITSSMLSQIERGLANPSLTTLIRIAEALNVQPAHLFIDRVAIDQLILRNNQRKTLSLPESVGVHYDLLTPAYKGQIELTEIVLQPHGISSNTQNTCEEKAVIIAGAVEIFLHEQWISLGTDDSIHIPCNTPHQWRNIHHAISRVITAKNTSST